MLNDRSKRALALREESEARRSCLQRSAPVACRIVEPPMPACVHAGALSVSASCEAVRKRGRARRLQPGQEELCCARVLFDAAAKAR